MDYDSGLVPFRHCKLKAKSNWNPVGPKVLEEFNFLNQEGLQRQSILPLPLRILVGPNTKLLAN